jgi:hypothetical protein
VTDAELMEVFRLIRQNSDPAVHGLIGALERMMITDRMALEAKTAMIQTLDAMLERRQALS